MIEIDNKKMLESLIKYSPVSWITTMIKKSLKDQGFEYNSETGEIVEVEDTPVSKFKEGDWVINPITGNKAVVAGFDFRNNESRYILRWDDDSDTTVTNPLFKLAHARLRLLTIKDAKDGDVLAYRTYKNCVCIFKEIKNDEDDETSVFAYCGLELGAFCIPNEGQPFCAPEDLIPATKEQRDLLFSKMKEAGYEWDAEKKELVSTKPLVETEQDPCDGCVNRKDCINCENCNLRETISEQKLTEFEEKFLALTDSWCHGDSRVYEDCREQALKDAKTLLSIARKQLQQEFVDKACEWLDRYYNSSWYKPNDYGDYKGKEGFIEDFRKAMEKGE